MTTNTLQPASSYRDPKRYAWLLSTLFPLFVAGNLWMFALQGSVAWLFLASAFVYIAMPLLDHWLGPDTRNPPDTAVAGLEGDTWYRSLTLCFVPLYYVAVVLGAALAVQHTAEPLVWLGLLLSVGSASGAAINAAHELGHKHPLLERWLARVTLAPVAYGHFYVEHNRGHHRRVATFEDPASSRLGESLWAFLPRTVLGSLQSAWHIEAARLAGHNLSPWHWRNECLQAWAMTVLVFGAITAWLGPWALLFLVLQAVYGFSLLEVVNYLEHYGLKRSVGADGKLQRCLPEHSWNSNHVVSNLFLYHLQRHSDHHAHPARRYQALRHFEQAPQLPNGYAGMVLLAYVPWLWFKVMDKRVLAHYGGDVRRANVQPGSRWESMAKSSSTVQTN